MPMAAMSTPTISIDTKDSASVAKKWPARFSAGTSKNTGNACHNNTIDQTMPAIASKPPIQGNAPSTLPSMAGMAAKVSAAHA